MGSIFRSLGTIRQVYTSTLYRNDTSGDVQVPDHFELLYKNDGHYEGIMALSGGLSTVRLSRAERLDL